MHLDPKQKTLPHRQRDRQVRVAHYEVALRFDLDQGQIEGRVDIQLEVLRELEHLELHAVAFEIEQIARAERALAFENSGADLRVDMGEVLPRGEQLTLSFSYRARPRSGMFFRHYGDSAYVFTCGEGGLHANWLPLANGLNDKSSIAFALTVPHPYVAIANGRDLGVVAAGADHQCWHWRQERPISNHLFALYVGRFERGELANDLGLPMHYWVPPGHLEAAAHCFATTPAMVAFFNKRLGFAYPWDKYDQVVVPDYHTIGALENNSVTGHNASLLSLPGETEMFTTPAFDAYHTGWSREVTIAHELAHHWFGNLLTCRDLTHVWTHESFATYLSYLWTEHAAGREAFLFDLDYVREMYKGATAGGPGVRPLEFADYADPGDSYDVMHVYLKGACVLHMLRDILGDNDFFASVHYFLDRHQYGSVMTRDFELAVEETSGRELGWFFDQWIRGGGHPRLAISRCYHPDRKVLELTVAQTQSIIEGRGLFRLPLTVSVTVAQDVITTTHWLREASETLLIPCQQEPTLISIDPEGVLIADIEFTRSCSELARQLENGPVIARLRALRELVALYPHRPLTYQLVDQLIKSNAFWGLRAEAVSLLGQLNHAGLADTLTLALQAPDHRIRKAAVTALAKRPCAEAATMLAKVIAAETQGEVVGNAVLALARLEGRLEPELVTHLLGRDSWYDCVRVACIEALRECENPTAFLPQIRPLAGSAHNQSVRTQALDYWAAIAPADPELARTLIAALDEAPYQVLLHVVEMLGSLAIESARERLRILADSPADANLSRRAKTSLEALGRFTPASA